MTKLEMADKIEQAIRLFNGGKRWIKGVRKVKRQKHYAYCAVGALEEVAPIGFTQIWNRLSEVEAKSQCGLMAANDSHKTKYRDLVVLLRTAVKNLRAEAQQEAHPF